MSPKSKTPDLDSEIDRNLKRVYEDTLKEELPSRFRDLIAQLKEQEGEKDGG